MIPEGLYGQGSYASGQGASPEPRITAAALSRSDPASAKILDLFQSLDDIRAEVEAEWFWPLMEAQFRSNGVTE